MKAVVEIANHVGCRLVDLFSIGHPERILGASVTVLNVSPIFILHVFKAKQNPEDRKNGETDKKCHDVSVV